MKGSGWVKSITERFDYSYKVDDVSGCWEWTESKIPCGYGKMFFGGRYLLAHRVSYEMNVGPIPLGHVVMHSCNNKACVNPEHLNTGTYSQNTKDAFKDGLVSKADRRGVKAGGAKLTDEDVRVIRSVYATGEMEQKEIAHFFGVSRALIGYVVNRDIWKHVA